MKKVANKVIQLILLMIILHTNLCFAVSSWKNDLYDLENQQLIKALAEVLNDNSRFNYLKHSIIELDKLPDEDTESVERVEMN